MEKRREYALQNMRPGDWVCGKLGCGQHNFASNAECYRCGATMAEAAEDLGEGEGDKMMGGPPSRVAHRRLVRDLDYSKERVTVAHGARSWESWVLTTLGTPAVWTLVPLVYCTTHLEDVKRKHSSRIFNWRKTKLLPL
eukprot:1156628-Prorocentrum_minimum.AAC.1